jgi:hypothetical protein
MGMYTGIKFKGIVKEEFRKDFHDIAFSGEWQDSKHEIFKEFGKTDRAGFIPNGALCYMPNSWVEFSPIWNEDTGLWEFSCSLKNYSGTIERFLDLIPEFIDTIFNLEYLYEEDEFSIVYDLIDNKVVCIGERRIL